MIDVKKLIRIFILWLLAHFRVRYIFVPFGSTNTMIQRDGKMYGYRDYYVFGIRAIRLQQTRPWTDGG